MWGWKHGKVCKISSYLQGNKKFVQFLTQVKESRLKIIENIIKKHGAFLWVYNEGITKFEKLWHKLK
jgi:hypothetical protein